MLNSIMRPASLNNRIPNIERWCGCCLLHHALASAMTSSERVALRCDDHADENLENITHRTHNPSISIYTIQYNGIERRIRTNFNALLCDYCIHIVLCYTFDSKSDTSHLNVHKSVATFPNNNNNTKCAKVVVNRLPFILNIHIHNSMATAMAWATITSRKLVKCDFKSGQYDLCKSDVF